MIVTARQLQEKWQEQNMDLYMNFVDLTKNLIQSVVRDFGKLWQIWLSDQVHSNGEFHDGMLARVQNDGEFSDPFPVTNGVKQGCVLAPTLFSMMFSAMLTTAFQDGENGIHIRYRFDGKLFQPKKVASQIQGADRGVRRVPLC